MVAPFEDLFPGLRGKTYHITSPKDDHYNRIAWAVGDIHNWWWPDPEAEDTWPEGLSRTETVEAFRDMFATLGYLECEPPEAEPGHEKITLFATSPDAPKHAARQLANGRWTSKLGQLEDIEHDLHELEGLEYGSVVLLMKRLAHPAKDEAPAAPESGQDH